MRSQELLRAYDPLRVAPDGATELGTQLEGSDTILTELWSIAEALAREAPYSEMLALYVEALNETIDLDTSRVTTAVYACVRETVLLLLFVRAALALGMVGFNAGLTGRRSPLTAIVMIVVLGAVVLLIVDIDRPRGGTLTVSQQPMIELQERMDEEAP